MAKRQGITKKTRFEVFKRDSFICQYCGQSAPQVVLHVDHIQPVSKDGTNDMLNLITSCDTCNAGKSDNLLSDDSAVRKQKAQLDELNERREQIEMMLEWRNGLQNLGDMSLEAICDAWTRATVRYYLTDYGKDDVKKLLAKYSLATILDAIDKSVHYLELGEHGRYTEASVDLAWNKVGGICKLASMPEWLRELYHIRNIARKLANGSHWHPSTSHSLVQQLKTAYESGVPMESLKDIATKGLNYNQLCSAIEESMEQYG